MRTQPVLTSVDTQKIMAACKAEALKNNWGVSIAIVDASGALMHFERLDGAPPISVEAAQGKAQASASLRGPTRYSPGLVQLKGVWIQGGIPLMFQGECVGAVGVSGLLGHEDEQVASAGVAALT